MSKLKHSGRKVRKESSQFEGLLIIKTGKKEQNVVAVFALKDDNLSHSETDILQQRL